VQTPEEKQIAESLRLKKEEEAKRAQY